MAPPVWPTVNASLNATSAALLLLGYVSIRAKRIGMHLALMLAACMTSTAFFISYALYHARVGSVHFSGQGWSRAAYAVLLISHTVLAIVIVPLVVRTLGLALQRRLEAHARLARVAFPLWLYVSVSGVLVYAMLYRRG